jgi:hypothetical protein
MRTENNRSPYLGERNLSRGVTQKISIHTPNPKNMWLRSLFFRYFFTKICTKNVRHLHRLIRILCNRETL